MPPTPEETVAANVRQLRTGRGLTQVDLAELLTKAGCRQSAMTVWNLENNRRRINVGDLVVLAEVFETTPQQLLSTEPEAPAVEKPVATYAVTVDEVTEVVQADRSDVDLDGWLNFYLRGERVFFAPADRVLCVRAAGRTKADDRETPDA